MMKRFRSCSRRPLCHRSWQFALLLTACFWVCRPLVGAPPSPNDQATAPDRALASALLEKVGMNRGLCAVLGGGDGRLPVELAQASELLVHVREPDAERVARLRKMADSAGFDIARLAVEHGALSPLPYADRLVDAAICIGPDGGAFLETLSVDEVLRVLRPQGVAIVGTTSQGVEATEKLQQRLRAWTGGGAKTERIESWTDSHGTWVQFYKPATEGAADWSHWEKSPDNNPVSEDAIIEAPYMTQFMAEPYYIGMPAITTVAGGRTFLAMGHIAHHGREWDMLNRIIARDGYNGITLWEYKLPNDYLVHRSAFIATPDTFYMMNGDHCKLLDARTGAEKGEIRIAEIKGAWKWMAMVDGVLYVMAGKPGPGAELVKGDRAFGGWSWADLSKGYFGKRIPHGFGDVIAAYDLDAKKLIWQHREDSLIDSRGMAIKGEKLFLYCPDKHLRCLNRKDGKPYWTNDEKGTLELVEQPGKGLRSTPGWRTQTMVVATPDALVIQGQTRMNVIGVSTASGSLLWQKKKITNNPNALYLDGKVIVGVGPGGNQLALDPVSGKVLDDLGFAKRACTRLTASTDSIFCRGEGMTRFDRATGKVQIDGAVRPACNDGVIPANGLLYLGPWACDCNLSLIGNVARCSAGAFKFDIAATTDARLKAAEAGSVDLENKLSVSDRDWPTYRGSKQRSSSSVVALDLKNRASLTHLRWHARPERPHVPSEAVAADGLIFAGGDDGKVRAFDGATGAVRWTFTVGGVVKYPPTIWEGRAFFGSGDGYAYCLDASTGRLLWRFRASPTERHIMVYGHLSSTWPVNTGVLVHGGKAYFAAGIVDHDGTYVYALDAKTGDLAWQNNSSGHLNRELRKGVSAQGNLSILGKRLLLAGGNVISPASFDLETGACLETQRRQGQPQSNGGKFVGVFDKDLILAGGRILYSSPRNVSTKGSFNIWSAERQNATLNFGGIPPAWNDDAMVVANFRYGRVVAFDTAKVAGRARRGFEKKEGRPNRFNNAIASMMTTLGEERWQSSKLGDAGKFEVVSLAVCPNAILAVARFQDLTRARAGWYLTTLNPQNGNLMSKAELPGEPLPGGLLIDRDGHIVVTLLDAGVLAYGPAS